MEDSYIVKGEKTAIVDGVCGWDGVPETLFKQFESMDVNLDSIDYVIINHMEPDHSGWLEDFKKIRPRFKVITNERAVPLLDAFFDITLDVEVVRSKDTLDLGGGRVLTFEYIPNVHWPETMATFDTLSGTLFSCDAFGSFGRFDALHFDDQLSQEQIEYYENETVRYYSNIVAAFSQPVIQAVKKCRALPLKVVAPGHGIIWRKNPGRIIGITFPIPRDLQGMRSSLLGGSMYGYTQRAVRPAIDLLEQEGQRYGILGTPDADR